MEIAQKANKDNTAALDRIRVFHLIDRFFARIERWLNLIGVLFILAACAGLLLFMVTLYFPTLNYFGFIFGTLVFIAVMMILTAVEIVGRYLFNHPIPGYVEDVELIMAAIVFLGFGYTQRVGAHIRMDMVINRLTGRTYHLTEATSALLGLLAYGIICVSSFFATIDAYQMKDVTEYLYTPTWPSKLCVPLGSFFLCVRFFLQALKNLGQAVVGVEIRDLE